MCVGSSIQDQIDKRFVFSRALFFWRGQPRGEERSLGWKLRQPPDHSRLAILRLSGTACGRVAVRAATGRYGALTVSVKMLVYTETAPDQTMGHQLRPPSHAPNA